MAGSRGGVPRRPRGGRGGSSPEPPGGSSSASLRGIERPSAFLLVIAWETLEDHTVGFRGGELFVEWRALIGPFFAEPPEVEHWTEAVTPAPAQ